MLKSVQCVWADGWISSVLLNNTEPLINIWGKITPLVSPVIIPAVSVWLSQENNHLKRSKCFFLSEPVTMWRPTFDQGQSYQINDTAGCHSSVCSLFFPDPSQFLVADYWAALHLALLGLPRVWFVLFQVTIVLTVFTIITHWLVMRPMLSTTLPGSIALNLLLLLTNNSLCWR